MCQGLLTRAREIIKKDLHDSVKCEFKVRQQTNFSLLYILQRNNINFLFQEVKSDVDNQILVEQLDKYTFSFPTCQIR